MSKNSIFVFNYSQVDFSWKSHQQSNILEVIRNRVEISATVVEARREAAYEILEQVTGNYDEDQAGNN